MELNRKSWIVWWAYLWEGAPPHQTSLCALFWRTVALSPVKVFSLGCVIALIGSAVYEYPWRSVALVGVVASILGAIVLIAWLVDEVEFRHRPRQPEQPSVVRDGFRAIKGKVCPIVTLTDRQA